jgi:hypothetical protein
MLPSVNQSGKAKIQNLTSERKDATLEEYEEGSGQPTFPLPSPSTGGAAAARALREAGRSGDRLHGLGLEVRPPCPQEPFRDASALLPAGSRRGSTSPRSFACWSDVAARATTGQWAERANKNTKLLLSGYIWIAVPFSFRVVELFFGRMKIFR